MSGRRHGWHRRFLWFHAESHTGARSGRRRTWSPIPCRHHGLRSPAGTRLTSTRRFRPMTLRGAVTGTHRGETFLWNRDVFVSARMVPSTMLEDRVLCQAGPRRITCTSILRCALSAVSRFERYSWLLLSRPPTAMTVRLTVRRVARTMPTFILALSFVRHFLVTINRQSFDTVNIHIIQ